jgi:CheY-like chemotaxis protein
MSKGNPRPRFIQHSSFSIHHLFFSVLARNLQPEGFAMAAKPKVLVVEDDPEVRRLYAIGLNQRGFEVKLAANGAEAVERIHAEQPHVVLLDWMMPLMTGGEVLAHLEAADCVQVIVISGQPEPPEDARDPRILSWLTKPVSIDDVVQEIERPRVSSGK